MSARLPQCYYDVGLVAHYDFRTRAEAEADGFTFYGDPDVSFGLILDSSNSQYCGKNISPGIFKGTALSWDLKLQPSFTPGNGSYYCFFDAVNDSGTTRFLMSIQGDGQLIVTYAGVTFYVALAAYSDYLKTGVDNLFSVYGGPTSVSVLLNGNVIATNVASYTSITDVCCIYFGSLDSGSWYFNGKMVDFKIFHATNETQEHIDAYENKTFSKENVIVDLPCTRATYDPDNSRTEDVSGYANHGTLNGSLTQLSDGLIDLQGGNITIGSGKLPIRAASILAVIIPEIWGDLDVGRIFDNGTNTFNITSNGEVKFTGNGGTDTAVSDTGAIKLNKIHTVIMSRTSDGTTDLFVNGKISGTSGQSSGTPLVGTLDDCFFDRTDGIRSFIGTGGMCKIINRITTPIQAANYHNEMMGLR